MVELEDTMNVPLCGLFLILLLGMCFDAFSAVTVRCSSSRSTDGGSYVYELVYFHNEYPELW
jgi:hypothetical protein